MEETQRHIGMGAVSIILGVLGLIFYFIGWFFFSFLDNRFYGMSIGIVFSILATLIGYIAKKQGDTAGNYGMIRGGLVIIVTIIIFILSAPTSVEYG